MQSSFSYTIFVELLSLSMVLSQCIDGINNVIFVEDIGGGKVEISRAIKTEQGRLIAQLTLKQDSFLLGEICNRGTSVKYVSADTCSFDFCEAIGEQHCNLFRKPGIITLDDLSDTLKKFLPLPTAPTKLVSGQWKMSVRLTQNGRVIGEFQVGRGGEWINVEASTYRDEL